MALGGLREPLTRSVQEYAPRYAGRSPPSERMSRERYERYECEFCHGHVNVDIPLGQNWGDYPSGWIQVQRKPGPNDRADYCCAECAARSFYDWQKRASGGT